MKKSTGNSKVDLYHDIEDAAEDGGGGKGAENNEWETALCYVTGIDGTKHYCKVTYEVPAAFNTPWQMIELIEYPSALNEEEIEEIKQEIAAKYYGDMPFI